MILILLLLEHNNNFKNIYILYKVIEGNTRNMTLCLHFQHLLHYKIVPSLNYITHVIMIDFINTIN